MMGAAVVPGVVLLGVAWLVANLVALIFAPFVVLPFYGALILGLGAVKVTEL